MSLPPEKNEPSAASEQAPVINSHITVKVIDGGLKAVVRITPPSEGGEGPTFEKLREALASSGVTVGIDLDQLTELAADPVYDEDVVVAYGVEPINGQDGTATLLIQTENKGRPKVREDDRVDYLDLGLIENVTAGQPLCTLTLPTEGTPGTSVRGDVLRPKTGKPAPIIAGPNTELTPDGLQIISKINGQFEFDGKRISVSETYTIQQNVDASTGNIKVAGNLVIRGMVTSGLTVEADGYITVMGVVDSATITAGKDIILQGGANGSTLTCQGNLKSRFIENCNVFAKGNIQADYILNSNVRCKKSLKTEGVISKIIGGSCTVLNNIECRTIGSAAGIKTKLEIGNDPELLERQRYLNDLIPELEKQIKNLEPLLKLLRQMNQTNKLDPDKKATLEKATYSHETLTKQLEDAKRELVSINNSLRYKNFGKIICRGVTYPGTVIIIGSATYTVTSNLMNTSFFYQDGEVTLGTAR